MVFQLKFIVCAYGSAGKQTNGPMAATPEVVDAQYFQLKF